MKQFFEWVAECCKELNWDVSEGVKFMPDTDPCWYFCYDDGLTPKQAVSEAIKHGVVKRTEELELKD